MDKEQPLAANQQTVSSSAAHAELARPFVQLAVPSETLELGE
jgi:hypothetical protein